MEVSVNKLAVATSVELDVQLNDTFERYQVGVAEHLSPDVVSRPIKWADCIHPRNACTFVCQPPPGYATSLIG